MSVTVFALFYGDHLTLAQRLTASLTRLLDRNSPATELRFGLNAVSAETCDYLRQWALQQAVPTRLYHCQENVGKYPLMRRMFRSPEIRDSFDIEAKLLWFDDDSYVLPIDTAEWWQRWRVATDRHKLCGQIWHWPLKRGQQLWLNTQPWFAPQHLVTLKGKPAIRFSQGAGWSAQLQALLQLDWPIPELYHTGGDSLLGLRVACAGWTIGQFDYGLCINCDSIGRKSKASRRGMNPQPIGYNYPQTPVRLPDHQFHCHVEEIAC